MPTSYCRARVVSRLEPPDTELVNVSKFVEFMGGLGDVLIRCHQTGFYEDIVELPKDQNAYVSVISHNPNTKELFEWVPSASRITIVDPGFHYPWDDQNWRKTVGLPKTPTLRCRDPKPIRYYPSPRDETFIYQSKRLSRYIVIAPSSGEISRSVPEEIIGIVASECLLMGFGIVRIGKSYTHRFNAMPDGKFIVERDFSKISWTLDLSEKLTVPGACTVIMNASGIVCSHSAMGIVAQYGGVPFFLLYPRIVKERFAHLGPYGYMFGIDRPTSDHAEFSEFTVARFRKWLSVIK